MAFGIGLGTGLTVASGAAMTWQTRRHKAAAGRRRHYDRAARTKLWGYVGVIVAATLARAVAPVCGLSAFGIGLVVVMLGVVAVHLVVRRQDPRVRFWRRPDPLPDGREPDAEPAQKAC